MGVADWTWLRRDSVNLEDASIETSKTEMQREREKKKRNEKDKIFKNHWTIYRKCSMYVKGIQAHVGGGRTRENILKIIIYENFSKFVTDTKPQIQKTERSSNGINSTPTKHLHLGLLYSNCRNSTYNKPRIYEQK